MNNTIENLGIQQIGVNYIFRTQVADEWPFESITKPALPLA